ncbi:MAG: DUF4827 domain-containing protein [Dysgonamonadaceae bacterium]|jgi:hypothetical protein|nr:DUF4827 domain-containing protein [Dysgonamonadaceae bacterium]
MKKILCFIFGIIAILFISAGCNSEKSMQELIREEKKAIERYIANNRLNILTSYPSDSVFGEKDFFKTNEGVYFRVTEKGTGEMATIYKTEVTLRVDSVHYFAHSDTSIYSMGSINPFEFIYGLTASYIANKDGMSFCPAWAIPLKYVGVHAKVDMIVPSEYGTATNNSSFTPVFYKGVEYTNFP